MALLKLKSTNKNLSYIINKNPTSGMQVRSIRKGTAFGWFPNESTDEFCMFFKDSETEVSFKSHENEDFEYVNKTRYNSAVAGLNMLSEFLDKTIKKEHELDVQNETNQLTLNMLHIHSDRVLKLATEVEGFKCEIEEVAKHNYRVTIATNKSIRELLNFGCIFLLYAALKNNRDFVSIGPDVIQKYFKCIDVIDPPYHVRYVFKINLLHSRSHFDKYKGLLEHTNKHNEIKMTFGGTHYARRDWLKSFIGNNHKGDIVDIGCGEGFYAFDLAKKIGGDYYAIDTNPELVELMVNKRDKRKVENMHVFGSHEMVKDFTGKTVLLIEVIEHIPYKDAINLVQDIIKKNPSRLFITTPNKEFNKHYFGSNKDAMRHDDHHFELTENEFRQTFLDEAIPRGFNCLIGHHDVGDKVDGVSTTMGVIIGKLEESDND